MAENGERGRPLGRRFFEGLARAIVWLRFPIIVAWIAAAVLAATQLPSISSANTGELGNLLPKSSQALSVERRSREAFRFPILSHILVVARKPGGFERTQIRSAARYVARVDEARRYPAELKAIPLLNAPGIADGAPSTTIAAFVFMNPDLTRPGYERALEDFAAGLRQASGARSAEATGTIPAGWERTIVGHEWLTWLELATIALVVGVLAIYFRAVAVPLLGVATVAIAYLIATHGLGWLGLHVNLSIPQEVHPVVVALLFGTLTDYVVFFVSGYRHRLRDGVPPREAVTGVTAELLPVILTAGLMIAGATMTLLISGVRFLSAFGPGMAVTVLAAAATAVTFVPAVIAVVGPALLWPRGVAAEPGRSAEEHGTRGKLVGAAAAHPAVTAVLCLLVLGAAASGIRSLALGNPVIRALPSGNPVHAGYEAAARGFGPGIAGPTALLLEEPDIVRKRGALNLLQGRLSSSAGVASVIGPADRPGRRPIGAALASSGDAARYLIFLDADPNGARATAVLDRLGNRMPAMLAASGLSGAEYGFAGDTAIASELNDDTEKAFVRITPAAVAVLLLLLWMLLRSRVAPFYLVCASAIVVVAALGLTVYVFQGLLGYEQLSFFVPIAAAILLISLGSDYNVFLVSRIWREAGRRDLHASIRAAGTHAGRAITVAGVILSLSFGIIALVPLRGFRELAFALAVGLALDTALVRTLLIPALVSLFGRGGEPA